MAEPARKMSEVMKEMSETLLRHPAGVPSSEAVERTRSLPTMQGAMMRITSVLLLALFSQVVMANEPLVYVPGSTKRVCQLTGDVDRATGKPTLNQTDKNFGIWGTDLGSSFEHKGKLYFLFGDTIGRPGDRDVLAWTESHDPSHIQLHFFLAPDRKWLPLTVPGISQGAFEVPSAGISLEDKMYVVCTTGHSEKKKMGRSVLARSDDDGKTFKKLHQLSHDKFINVSFWKTEKWLYVFGSGDYRKSNVFLARVPPNQIEDQSKMEFFSGGDKEPNWSPKESDALPLFDQPQVGEFSVRFLPPVKQYVMLYNAEKPRGINMRSAPTPWGPWSKETVIFDPWKDGGYGQFMHISSKFKEKHDALSDPKREEEWGGEYGPYIINRFTRAADGNCRIFYTMSTWNPYQVMIMQTDLKISGR
jgi:uncharacterized protein DUF4185